MKLSYFLILSCIGLSADFVTSSFIRSGFSVLTRIIPYLDDFVELYDEFTNDPFNITSKERRLYEAVANITSVIKQVEENIPQVTIAKIRQLESDFSQIIHFEIKLDDLVKQINNIESKYDSFLVLRKKINNNSTAAEAIANRNQLTLFANSVVSFDAGSIRDSLSAIHDLIDIRESSSFYTKTDILSLILDNFNYKTKSRCLIDKSPQQLIFDTFTSLRLVQLKGEIMFEFSYMLLHLYTQGDYKSYMDDIHTEMRTRFKNQMEVVTRVISEADNSYWKCDPNKHVSGITYTELTHLLQGYIHNEREMNHKRTCFEGCDYYSYMDSPQCSLDDKLCKKQPSCRGRVFDCKFIKEDMKICFGNITGPRRYEWIKYKKGPDFGHTERRCLFTEDWVDGYRKYLFWRCMYCFCLCDEESIVSDRFFSLEPAIADIENNMVIVGVRFIKQDRVIHLQVKQGKLLSGGTIDNGTLSWVSLPKINVNNWRDRPKFHKLNYESRGLDLDDLVAPSKYLVTGVRFRTIGAHINLEVQLTGFDFESGALFTNLTFWKGNDNTDVTPVSPREKFDLMSKILPIETSDFSIPDSQPDTFLHFEASDERTDAAQSTVPFIDIQAVTPQPAIPLIGVGIIHKGSSLSAGFIEPKVFTYNIAQALSQNQQS